MKVKMLKGTGYFAKDGRLYRPSTPRGVFEIPDECYQDVKDSKMMVIVEAPGKGEVKKQEPKKAEAEDADAKKQIEKLLAESKK